MDYKAMFENYTFENFKDFFESHKLSEVAIEEQRKIKEVLIEKIADGNEVIRKYSEDLSRLDQKESKLYNVIDMMESLEKEGYVVQESEKVKAQNEMSAVKELRFKIKGEIEKQKQLINYIETALKENKFSEQKRQMLDVKDVVSEKAYDIKESVSEKVNDVKVQIKSAPQKICSASVGLLSRLRQKGKEKYRNLMETFEERLKLSEQNMEYLENEQKQLFENRSGTASERFSESEQIRTIQKREYRKIKLYSKSSNVLAKLRRGVVRSFDVSLDFYNKMNNKLEEKAITI